MSTPDSAPNACRPDRAADALMDDVRVCAAGLAALVHALGEAGAGRSLQLVTAHAALAPDPGAGDYTAERHTWVDQWTFDELMDALLALQAAGPPERPVPVPHASSTGGPSAPSQIRSAPS